MASAIKIPFVDLARQFRALEPELTQAFQEVGRSGMYVMGDRLASFERAAASYLGVKHAVGVSDGSNALFLTMKALGIGPGDEVITAPNSFLASAWTIVAVGARPGFADVAEDMNIAPAHLEAAITPRTRAVMPVHIRGRPADMATINEIADKHGLFVV